MGYEHVFLQGVGDRGVKLTTCLNLVIRLRLGATKPPLPHMPSQHTKGQLYFHFYLLYYPNFSVMKQEARTIKQFPSTEFLKISVFTEQLNIFNSHI